VDQDRWTAVDRYVEGLLAPHDAMLRTALEASEEAGLPAIQVSPPQGKLLYLLAKSIEATTIQTVGGKGYDGFAVALVV
jgi:predicted O-methyltransferase YrrM